MKITFLGTSHGVPERDRYCSCTCVSTAGGRYLIDAGGPVTDMLIRKGIAPEEIMAIFVIHMHGDHVNGLPAFTDLISWYFKTADPLIHLPDQTGVDALKRWNTAVLGSAVRDIRYEVYREGIIYDDGDMRVTALRSRHHDLSYSFKLEAEGKRVIFTGDLAGPDIDFPRFCFEEDCDAVICEAAHFPTTKAAPVFEKCLTKNIYINHISPRQAPSIEELLTAGTPYNLIPVYDGYEAEI